MACFVRRDLLNEPRVDAEIDATEPEVSPFPIEKFQYKLLFENDFPVNEDVRSTEEVIMDSVEYFFNRFLYKFDEDFYYNVDRDRYEFPLRHVFDCVHEAPEYEELKSIVITKYCIEEGDIVIVPVPVDDDSGRDLEDSGDGVDDASAYCGETEAPSEVW